MYWVPASREAYRENGISKLKVSSVYTPPPPIRGTDCTQTIKELRPACQTVCVTLLAASGTDDCVQFAVATVRSHGDRAPRRAM